MHYSISNMLLKLVRIPLILVVQKLKGHFLKNTIFKACTKFVYNHSVTFKNIDMETIFYMPGKNILVTFSMTLTVFVFLSHMVSNMNLYPAKI